MAEKKIVILGGGYAGIEAAKHLNKKFKKNPDVEITLIDKNTVHTLMTELHEVAGSRVEPESVQVSYQRIFSGTKVKLVTDFIVDVDFEKQTVKSEGNAYPYDYLIIGTGGSPEFFDVPGVQENSFTLWSLEDALRLREHVEDCFRLASREPDLAKRKRMLTFTVAGAGFTGIELAGELLERRDQLCSLYHLDPSEVRILVVEALDKILPILDTKLRAKADAYMAKKGAEVILNARIVGAEEGKVFLADDTVIDTDTFVWTCGIHGSEFTARIDLEKGQEARGKCSYASADGIHGMCGCRFEEDETYIVGKRGRILVDDYMQTPKYHNVFAVGDNLWFVENEKVLPQIVETALQTGAVAAHNIIADITGGEKKAFKSNYHGFMVSIGGRYAVSNAGGMKTSGFMAMAMKHLVNLHYLFGIAGINAIWAYLKHEFFDMKGNRTFIGGHLSWKIQGWWAFPLRLWLGLMWFMEGLNKIGEGWFKFSLGTKSGWMFSKGIVQAGVAAVQGAAADAVSAASDAAEEVAPVVQAAADAVSAASDAVQAAAPAAMQMAADIVSGASDAAPAAAQAAADAVSAASGAVADAAPAAVDAAHRALGVFWDLTKPIIPYDSGFVSGFRRIFMDNIASHLPFQFFQVMIVSVEIALGLALLGGLFTFPAAVVSIIMCFVFTFSGMFSWNQLWFVFAAFLLLGGGGRALGLDHWVMPWIKRGWNSTGLAKKSHLYVGEPVLRKKGKK